MNHFIPGEGAKLTFGGPAMVVTRVESAGRFAVVHCQWYEGGDLRRAAFPAGCLVAHRFTGGV